MMSSIPQLVMGGYGNFGSRLTDFVRKAIRDFVAFLKFTYLR